MMFSGLGVDVIVLRKSTQLDWRGDPIEGDEFVEDHVEHEVLVEMQSTSADKFLRDEYTLTGMLYMRLAADVLATDQLELPSGDRIHVMGKPFSYNLGHAMGKAIRFKEVGGYGTGRSGS